MEQHYKTRRNKMGYISADPLPSSQELVQFYTETYYQDTPTTAYAYNYSDTEKAYRKLRASLYLHAIGKLMDKGIDEGNAFLEVGCGEGFMLKSALAAGYDAHGIDFSDYGLRAFHPELLERLSIGDAFQLMDKMADAGDKVDVCVLQNIMEHVVDPAGLMQRIKQVLSKSGVAAINVPNDYSKLQRTLRDNKMVEEDYWFSPPQHLHYFNVDNLVPFIEAQGFEVLDIFGDFPIEIFLFHPGSNYVKDIDNGPAAHNARMTLDLMVAERGMNQYHTFCRTMATSGICRNLCLLVRPQRIAL